MTRVIRLPDPLSPNVSHLRGSETIATSAEARRRKAAGEDVLDLAVGEPDFDTPGPAAQAGILAIQRGYTRYPPNAGLPELRNAIARNLSRLSSGRTISPDHIVVSSGSKQALFNVCFTLFGSHDKVLIPAPCWVSYPQIVHLARAEPVTIPGAPDWGLKVSAEDLERHTDKLVRGLILCSPCNPTGAVYTQSELRAIAAWGRRHDVWIIADEIYRRIFFGAGSAPSFLDLLDEELERVVIITGASKAYAMTGWRIGAAIAPAHLVKAMANLQSHVTSGANQPAQWAAVTAFNDPEVEDQVVRMVQAFGRRRDAVVSRQHQHGRRVAPRLQRLLHGTELLAQVQQTAQRAGRHRQPGLVHGGATEPVCFKSCNHSDSSPAGPALARAEPIAPTIARSAAAPGQPPSAVLP